MTSSSSMRAETGADAVTWVCDLRTYQELVDSPDVREVPVLSPQDPRKATLWREVLRQRFVRHPDPEPGTRAVLAWGEIGQAPSRLLGRHSGSVLMACRSRDEVLTALYRVHETDVVVVGEAALFGATTVSALYATAAEVGKAVGIVCGRTEVELSYAVAKTVLHPAVPVRDDGTLVELFDAPEHRQQCNPQRPPGLLTEQLVRPAPVKILRSHGEGGHAKFPDVVICGLLDDAEFPHNVGAGCERNPRRCKRAVSRGSSVVFGDELEAGVVCFVCCNGFTVAGELYPSPVSMALSFTEGWAGAVIAPGRPLVAPDSLIESLIEDLSAGRRLGDVVNRLNRTSARLGQPTAFVLHGDPRLRRADPVNIVSPGPMLDRARVVPEETDDEVLDELSAWLVTMRRRADGGHRLVRAMSTWLSAEVADLLEPSRTGLERVESLVLHSLKWAEWRPAGDSLHRLLRTRMLVRLAVTTWDRQLAQRLLELRDRLDVFDLGHYDQLREAITEDAVCGRCDAPAEVHHYGAGEPPEDRREAILCRVCGPISEHRSLGLTLRTIDHLREGGVGDTFTWRVRLTVPSDQKVVPSVQLYLRFVDKARDVGVWSEASSVVAEDQDIEFSFPLPDELSADLHSVRLVAVSGFDIAYARVRFVGVPRGTVLSPEAAS